MTEFRGEARGEGLRVCIVVSRFNVMVTERLVDGAVARMHERGVAPGDLDIVSVPGAWELGIAARAAADRGYDAIVGLGCVIRGDTPHFEYVCRAAVDGLLRVQAETGTPVGLGVLTTENLPQALARSGGEVGHAGAQAADAALEIADLLRRLR